MPSKKRPNILLIYTDQQRYDAMSCNVVDSPIQTPNLDSIAAAGARFENCFVQSPICGPSRVSFLTGRYCSSTGVGTNGIAFPEDTCVPINQILHDYGYETAQLGKIHFQPHAKRDARMPYPNYGFDRFIVSDEPGCYDDPYTKWVEMNAPDEVCKVRTALPPAAYHYKNKPEYSTTPRNTHEPYLFETSGEYSHSAFVAAQTCDFLQERQTNKPFFAIAGFYAPHPPVNPPADCIDRVDVSKIKLPPEVPQEIKMEMLKDFTDADYIKMIQYYLALTVHVDDCVGQILNTLKETGADENTIIIFTTDHGEYLGEHGKVQKGMPGYDCCIHVPTLISYPEKVAAGTVVSELIESIDVVPTLLDWCGIQTPPYVQGRSMASLFAQLQGAAYIKPYEPRTDIICEHFVPYGLRETALRTNDYKYYCNSDGNELLFNLAKDPDELTNVAAQPEYATALSHLRFRALVRTQSAGSPNLMQDAEY